MQKRIAFLMCMVLAVSIAAAAQAGGGGKQAAKPRPSPPASAQCKFSDGKSIKVDYSSPSWFRTGRSGGPGRMRRPRL
jgi:hypothetical protein